MPTLVSRGRGRRSINEINMVPFIDVMLVLLIIFMVTAPMIAPSVIDLPSVGKAAQKPDRVVVVQIDKDQTIAVQHEQGQDIVNLSQLAPQVKKRIGDSPNVAVVIGADKQVPYETVVKALDQLQRAGIPRVGLSVQLTP
jgi:biopolymer transport protein TolR